MEITESIFVNIVVAGKYIDKEDKKHLEEANNLPCRFGRSWWYDYPKIIKTGIGWNACMFCFMITYDNYGNIKQKDSNERR